jgi:hypothetical protein
MKFPSLRICGALTLALMPLAAISDEAPSSASATTKLDFGDFSSAVITAKAWHALDAKNYGEAEAYAAKCQELYKAKAVEMQKSLTAPADTADKEKVHSYYALNDVGTCCFIQGKALEAEGKKKEAAAAYKFLAESLPFAQCWDTKGWFWKPADAARERLKVLEFDTL